MSRNQHVCIQELNKTRKGKSHKLYLEFVGFYAFQKLNMSKTIYFEHSLCKYLSSLSLQTLMTVHHPPVRTEALASMGSTPSSVSAQMAGRAACVMSVSVCVGV